MPATSGSPGDLEESATVVPVRRAGLAGDGEGELAGDATGEGDGTALCVGDGGGLGEVVAAGAGLGLTM